MEKKTAVWINLWAMALIASSFYGMIVLLGSGYNYYRYLHPEYSPAIIAIRYFVSWAVRIVGLISGIGILYRKEFFRKTAIAGSLFTILTIHLKHSAKGFVRLTHSLDDHFNIPLEGVTFISLMWPAIVIARMIDVIFAGYLIYFFTRREVKKYFRR